MTMYNCNFDGTKPFSDVCVQFNLAANGEQTFTVPGTNEEKFRAKFEFAANSNVFVGLNVTAATPAPASSTTTANLEFRPSEPKYVKGGDVIHLISPDVGGAKVGISLLSVLK